MNRKRILGVLGLTAGLVSAAFAEQSSPLAVWNFDKDAPGKAPGEWRVAETSGSGKTGKWTVAADESAPSKPNVLKLDTQAEDQTYNLCIPGQTSFKDLDLRVQVKADGGKVDQGGGLIWRCKDENNYYICRINPLEGNFRVYKVESGKRAQLASEKLETQAGRWYEVRAVMLGDRIECYVDGKKHLEATDATFKDAGMIGLWTKADASSSFDDFTAKAATAFHTQGTMGDKLGAQPQQIVDGRLVGLDMPADWKLSERARALTYTNPSGQDLAARWVNGEIVYRVSVGEVKVDPKTTKVSKEYIAVYAAPSPGDPPTRVERVPGQLAIYDTQPGDEGYSPVWHYHYVIVPREYQANSLRSEKDVLKSGYKVVPVDHFSN